MMHAPPDESQAPHHPAGPPQPTYTVLPNGQVQMTLILPSTSFIPPPNNAYPQPYPSSYPPAPPSTVYSSYPPQPQYINPQIYPMFVATPGVHSPYYQHGEPARDGRMIAMLITYLIGLFTFLPHLASIILGFVIVKRGYIQDQGAKSLATVCGIFELLGWCLCVSMSWYIDYHCENDYDWRGNYLGYYCSSIWIGWIFIIIWFAFALIFGIIRVVTLWKHAKIPARA